jgi:hypothetical protein
MLILVPAISGMIRDKQTESANKNSQMVFMAVQKYLNKCDYENVDLTNVDWILGRAGTNRILDSTNITVGSLTIDLSNVLSDEVIAGKWAVKVNAAEYRVEFATWVSNKDSPFNPKSGTLSDFHFATINAQDAATKTNGYILGCYPIGT